MPLIACAALMLAFAGNVASGALTGAAPLGDVPEMLLLLAAAVMFVAAILRSEAAAGDSGETSNAPREDEDDH